MTGIEIKDYDQKYLDEIIALWNECLLNDQISKTRFISEVLLDVNFDKHLALISVKDEKVIGFCLGIKRKFPYLTRGLESDRGWISQMFVKKAYRKKGIGKNLYEEVKSRLLLKGVKEITLCAYSPNYFTPGIDVDYREAINFFETLGYQRKSEAVSMYCNLFNYSFDDAYKEKVLKLQEKGIFFKPYNIDYLEKLIDFANTEFGGGWARNIIIANEKQEAKHTIIMCIDEDDNIIGYAMRKIDGSDSRFGPIGVKKAYRGYGIGSILIELMMNEAKKSKIYYFYFLWTSGDNIKFYKKHNFEIYRSYYLYRKCIK